MQRIQTCFHRNSLHNILSRLRRIFNLIIFVPEISPLDFRKFPSDICDEFSKFRKLTRWFGKYQPLNFHYFMFSEIYFSGCLSEKCDPNHVLDPNHQLRCPTRSRPPTDGRWSGGWILPKWKLSPKSTKSPWARLQPSLRSDKKLLILSLLIQWKLGGPAGKRERRRAGLLGQKVPLGRRRLPSAQHPLVLKAGWFTARPTPVQMEPKSKRWATVARSDFFIFG